MSSWQGSSVLFEPFCLPMGSNGKGERCISLVLCLWSAYLGALLYRPFDTIRTISGEQMNERLKLVCLIGYICDSLCYTSFRCAFTNVQDGTEQVLAHHHNRCAIDRSRQHHISFLFVLCTNGRMQPVVMRLKTTPPSIAD